MDDKPQEELLRDLLCEVAPPEFRAGLLAKTLQAARHRRRQRRVVRSTGVLACLGALIYLFYPGVPPQPAAIAHQPSPQSSLLVHSQSLPEAMIVRTRPHAESLTSSSNTVAWVQTQPADQLFQVIDDGNLLQLVAGHSAVLVYHNHSNAELIFAHAEDQEGIPIQ